MCGIAGYVGSRDALPIIVSGLEALEYRGYDSSGISVFVDGKIETTRATGKLAELKRVLGSRTKSSEAHIGIGHTRWATHGRPTETNAHPHSAGRVSLIHNGIIENYLELKAEMQREGAHFQSETDTEVAAHLLDFYLRKGHKPIAAMRTMCSRIRGSYAFLAIDSQNPDRVLVAKNATPIIIGLGEGETFVASDIPAILPYTRKIIILEDGDLAEVTAAGVEIENNGKRVGRDVQVVTWDPVTAQKGGFKHFMLKEIDDQGRVLSDTLRGRFMLETGEVVLPELEPLVSRAKNIRRVMLVACGTAWHACLVGKFLIETFARIPCDVDYASEFRYRTSLVDRDTLVIAVSQSGETLDTLGALESAVGRAITLAICNVVGASVCRKADMVLYTHAGPEISVASTKAFSTQLVALELLALFLAQHRGSMLPEDIKAAIENLTHLPQAVSQALHVEPQIASVAKQFYQASDFLFLGRGNCYPIALEGALKLKEISYIHAEGYPAGEMKHGPIALINDQLPVVMILQRENQLFEKSLSNLKEVEARGARVIVVTDGAAGRDLGVAAEFVVQVPFVSRELSPLLLNIPLQFLAYHVAVLNGTDVDLPRNLAKSVTVE